tara:strand:+ start:886 stop:1146 length:261 start_codon:yes stop_codon:yes gene_type:complete
MERVLNFIKAHWKRGLTLLALSAISTLAVLKINNNAIEAGKQIGRCEMVCSFYGADFTGFDKGTACQCEAESGWIFGIPVDPEYFK